MLECGYFLCVVVNVVVLDVVCVLDYCDVVSIYLIVYVF